jgi:uncharacterized DUF497 family protein
METSRMDVFEWDEANIRHIAMHEVTSEEAEQAIDNDPVDLGVQMVDGEERRLHIGSTNAGRVLMIATTWQDELLRVVTAFPPSPGFRQLYLRERGGIDGRKRN